MIISYLDASLGADVLNLLPEGMQADVIARIANLDTVGPDALNELEDVMQKKFKANTSLRATQVGGIKAAAAIMNFTNQEQESKIMKVLGKDDKHLVIAIQESMFVFENLLKSDDKSLQMLLRNVETDDLILALKGADEILREKLFSCMSSRAAANIVDEMEALGPVRLSEVQEAQKQIIEAEGKAKANRILSASLTDNILRDKGIEATLQLSESPNSKVVVVGSAEDGLPIILGK